MFYVRLELQKNKFTEGFVSFHVNFLKNILVKY